MSTGFKKGVKGKTVKHTYNKRYLDKVQGQVVYIDDDGKQQTKSLNKSKNWEIIELAPKIQPKTPKTERKERNRLEKKNEFKEHLKTRGQKKEKHPNSHKEEEETEDKEKKKESDEIDIQIDLYKVKPAFKKDGKELDFSNQNNIAVILEPEEKEKWTNFRHKSRRGSYDVGYNHSDQDYERIRELEKKHKEIDFKLANRTKLSTKI